MKKWIPTEIMNIQDLNITKLNNISTDINADIKVDIKTDIDDNALEAIKWIVGGITVTVMITFAASLLKK
ncbi:hypothetical protein B9T19_07655 [Ignatzschineria sp. F8392]|uniref:hypothetical protein n=1 Tax=Ignatzschineria sp. F8392 TaxID=1980117 RepID=UPI000B97DB3D|nr:hypothetical protein [Ignatzschineria sp. F8392]OYQ78713.1 hypothetical protein B9T19_07655 [Ignatzschineria sp. F8392]